jgi:hypothetical protein
VAKQPDISRGSWLLAEELLERGDAAFVDELRNIADPDKLGLFSAKWYADKRPASRRLMFEYLARPLNAFRHEALVKRLFKLAEKNGDDELMGRFLVAFDRSIRRVRKSRTRYDWNTRESWTEESIQAKANSTMPRDTRYLSYYDIKTGKQTPWEHSPQREAKRLFSLKTRKYLRRRAWRYFRQLGKQQQSPRYLTAVVDILQQYADEDVHNGVALLDNWGLVHILFHHSPAIVAKPNGWQLAPDGNLAALSAAPAFLSMWQASSAPLLVLLKQAQCRVVRQWTVQMLRAHHPKALTSLPLAELLQLLASSDQDIAQLALEALRGSPNLGLLSVEQWLQLLDDANPNTLDLLCELLIERLAPGSVTIAQAVKLACSRPLPVAQLGLKWLQAKKPASAEECELLLSLAEAEADPVRGPAIAWLKGVLSASPHFQARWILDLLDSRHLDVRREAWQWFLAEPRASHNVSLWQRLLESPYDDIRLPLVEHLEANTKQPLPIDRSQFNPELVRFLWASVLLNIQRGHRHKPQVVAQIVNRLQRQPQEAAELLPILSVALRSIRGPEFRAGLAGVVVALERSPELAPAVKSVFPELQVF